MRYLVMKDDNRWQKTFNSNELKFFFSGIPQKKITEAIINGDNLDGFYIDELVEEDEVDTGVLAELKILSATIDKQITQLKEQNKILTKNIKKIEKSLAI